MLAGQGAGKGDKPRHTLNKQWQDNYDSIDWKPRVQDLITETFTVKRHTI